jgi:hypothetical protein
MDMISFLDRLGEEDLYGVEWSILHGLESLKNHNNDALMDWKSNILAHSDAEENSKFRCR